MEKITADRYVVRKADIVAAEMDGETVMMNIASGKYYNLGQTGGLIWSLMEEPIRLSDLIGILVKDYEVTEELCTEEVLTFLERMLGEELVSFSE